MLKTEEITGAKILPFPPVVILTSGFLFIRLVISHSTARGGETTTHWKRKKKKKKQESAADKPLIDVALYVKLYQIIKTSIQEYKVIFGSLEKTKGRKEGRKRLKRVGMWSWPWSKGPSGFGYFSTAEEVSQGIDASNLTAIVTGSSIDLLTNQ